MRADALRRPSLPLALAGVLALALSGCASPPAPKAERWTAPPIGATWETAQRNTGTYGADARLVMTRSADGTSNGRPAIVFTNSRRGALKVDPNTGRWFELVGPSGLPVVSFDPPLGWSHLLEVGQSWTTPYRMTMHAAGGRVVDYELSCRVEEVEKVSVPAGTFDAFRIACASTIDNRETYWSSPDLGIFVKTSVRRGPGNPFGAGTQETELVAETIRP